MRQRSLLITALFMVLFQFVPIGLAIVQAAPSRPEKMPKSSIVEGNGDFAFELYKMIGSDGASDGKNIFFSPYSISTALGMTYAGARGETEKQMSTVLHFGPDQDALHRSFHELSNSLDGAGKTYQLSIGNALWGQKNYPFDPGFLALVAKYYTGGFNTVDFIQETEPSRQRINQWVADKTADKIKDLLQQGDVSELTRLVLTNAIYFKGDWATQFDKIKTQLAPFTLKSAETTDVQMMSQSGRLLYGETALLQAVEVPYAGDDLSMLILLPRGEIGGMEEQLSRQQLEDLRLKMTPTQLNLYLPRFKFDARYGLHDKKYLPAMGMVDAFDERLADFSGLTGKKELFISGVFHKAFIDVNESGTEAAAATAVVVGLKSMPLPPTVFRADHPFVFLILHNPTQSILFMGRVANPAK